MLLQVKVPAEPLVAVSAGEGLPLVVGVHVESQVVDLGNWDNFIWINKLHSPHPKFSYLVEGLVAYCALVCLLS